MSAAELLYLSDYFGGGPGAGGAGLAALQSWRAVRALGVRARLVAGYALPPELADDPDAASLGGEDLRAAGGLAAARALYNPSVVRPLAAELARADPERTVVVLHQWTRWLSPSALAQLARFRVMVVMHDYFWACPNGAHYDFRQEEPCGRTPLSARCLLADCDRAGRVHKAARVVRQAVKQVVARGDPRRRLLLSVSERSRARARRLLPGETHALLHNPLPPPARLGRARAPADWDVGYFGRLEPEKGVADLLDTVRWSGRSAVFVGAGALAGEVRAALGDAAVIDWADHAQALQLMRRCRAVVLPSRWPETWGLVTAEALAQGRPVVVSERAGSAELVERFGGGALFDPDGPGDLGRALAVVLDGEGAEREALAAAPHVAAALAPERHAERLLALAAERWGVAVTRSAGSPPAAAALQPAR